MYDEIADQKGRAMESQAITGQKTRRGFNLIESAIVLGVVGVVVGGIWWAASAVIENRQVNKFVDDSLLIPKCIMDKFPRIQCGDYLCDSNRHYKQTQFFDNIGCIPEDFTHDAEWYYNPFHAKFNVTLFAGGSYPRIHTYTYAKSVAQCAKIANRIARVDAGRLVRSIQIGIYNHDNFRTKTLSDFEHFCKTHGLLVIIQFKM